MPDTVDELIDALNRDDNNDYITLLATISPHKQIVAVMHYSKSQDSYQIHKCSEPLSTRGAAALAESWAAALKVEIR